MNFYGFPSNLCKSLGRILFLHTLLAHRSGIYRIPLVPPVTPKNPEGLMEVSCEAEKAEKAAFLKVLKINLNCWHSGFL
jgi:hypothetical protein